MLLSWLRRSRPKTRAFLALGDSIISDDYPGEKRGAASLVHRNLDQDFPEFRSRDLSALGSVDLINLSRTGFQLSHVERSLQSLPPDLDVGWLMLSVGGNDLLSGELEGPDAVRLKNEFEQRYARLVRDLRQRFPQASFAILNGYDPTDGTGLVASASEKGKAPRLELLDNLSWLNRLIANAAGEDLVDIHAHFLGHGVKARPDQLWYFFDIEPNRFGASEARRLTYARLTQARVSS